MWTVFMQQFCGFCRNYLQLNINMWWETTVMTLRSVHTNVPHNRLCHSKVDKSFFIRGKTQS